MVLKAFFRKLTMRGESAYDVIERLMTPELATLMAGQAVASARAQIQANLKLGQRAQAREACDRILKVLDAYQFRSGTQAGRVELLRASILGEAERFEEAKIAYQNLLDGKVLVDDKALRLQAQAGMDLIRKKLQARLTITDPNAQHLAVFYVCIKCGHLRLFLSAPCESCLYRPNSDDSMAASLMCVSGQMDFGSMLSIGVRLRKGEKLAAIIEDLAKSVQQAKAKAWFKQSAEQIRLSTDTRSTRIADFASCSRCKAPIRLSMQDECDCGAPLKLPSKQRLLICLDSLVRQVEDRWSLPREWASIEWVSALIWARYFLLAHRQVPDRDLQSYLRDLLPKIGVLYDREDRGFVKYDEQGDPTIVLKVESEEDIQMLTLYFTLFNVENRSMQKYFQDCVVG